MFAAVSLLVSGLYLVIGLAFAVPFAIVGAARIDPHASRGTWGFRLLIIPGAMLLWPILLRRWIGGRSQPPEENTAHRRAGRGRETK